MNAILLDTHVLLWTLLDDALLKDKFKAMIRDKNNTIYYSTLSILEVEIKIMKHPDEMPLTGERLITHCERAGFWRLDLNAKHILELKNLKRKENTPPHRDPFDRLMICQAIVEGMIFMTHDARIAEYVSDSIYKI
ncbi:MAG: type II toxin-antitoxin system VapC family toxin [Selenomonadaceae bacterium]|nr:type II toxin-antitoxin system VapC family toxin [Selenomonadaceae bacterium]